MKRPDRRQFLYLAGLGGATALGGAVGWLAAQARQYGRERALQLRVLHLQAEGVADKIGWFIRAIEAQLAWTTELPLSNGLIVEQRRDVSIRWPSAITELWQLDSSGRQQLKVSRVVEFFDGPTHLSQEFTVAMAKGVYYGPVYLRRQWPYMTLALARTQRDGVSIAEIDVKFVCDMVARVKIGQAYVIDAQARLIAHPDIRMVLRNTDTIHFAHLQAARTAGGHGGEQVEEATDIYGHDELIAYAPVVPPGWLVFVELPLHQMKA
jgi:hypothetical protein